MSVRLSVGSPRACSGLIYAGVPMAAPASVAPATGGQRIDPVEPFRNPEVENLHLAFLRQRDVGGLQVAMDDALFMGRIQPVGDLARHREDARQRHRIFGLSGDHASQRRPLDQFHDQRRCAAGLVEAKYLRDVRMIERGQHPRFPLERHQPLAIAGHGDGEDLDRDVALEPRVVRAIDLAHPARSQDADDVVPADAGGPPIGVRGLEPGTAARTARRWVSAASSSASRA